MEKDPFNYSLLTYMWVAFVAAMGGLVNFHRKLQEGLVRVFNLTEFIGELFTSAFAGVLTFWLCEWSSVPPLPSAVLIAISGHMGSRAIFGIENWMMKKFLGK